MKNICIVILFFLLSAIGLTQTMEKIMVSKEDPYSFYLFDGESTDLFYHQIIPKSKAKGVLVIFPSGGQTVEGLLKEITLHTRASNEGMIVIIPSYNWGTFQRVPDIEFLNGIFEEVVNKHKVSKHKFVFCGLSNGGMISLTYAIHANKFNSTYLTPIGVVGIDPPLDYARFYRYCEREVARNYSEAGVAESKFFLNVYNQIYEGHPDKFPENYVEASIYSFGAPEGGNAKYLKDIGILMYSDLNTDYLINQKHRNLHDWNGTDAVAFVNQLKINGNKNAAVNISHNKGKRLDGSLNPHSWSILETDKTMRWIMDLIERKTTN